MNGTSPLPVPVQERSLVRAIRGPIMLITIGTLFAIDHFGPYSFSNTWPAVLIIIGLLKLLERAGQTQTPGVS